MYQKDFDKWNKQKQNIHFNRKNTPYFKEGEIRWINFGKNIKTEVLGKGNSFSRPGIIFKKLYGHSCLIIPLTSQKHLGSYYYQFQDNRNKTHFAIFSQIRYIDGSRIRKKIGHTSKIEFVKIHRKFIKFLQSPQKK